jgi:hypothetical protein
LTFVISHFVRGVDHGKTRPEVFFYHGACDAGKWIDAAVTNDKLVRDMNTFPIITKLGGIEAVYELLSDKISSSDTIRMWQSRSQIPSWAMRRLMEICEKRDIPYRAIDFYIHRRVVTRHNRSGAIHAQATASAE